MNKNCQFSYTRQRLTNKEAYAQFNYCTMIKHDEHFRTRRKGIKQAAGLCFLYISKFSSVLKSPECFFTRFNTQVRLLHLLYDIEVMWKKTIKHAFSTFYTLIKYEFLTNQSACRVLYI